MLIVDTHVHAGEDWFEPVETLLFEMERYGVAQAVLIQYRGHYDNAYILECVRRYPDKLAAAVLVDTAQPDALDKLEQCARDGAVGIRLLAGERSPGPDPLAIWRQAERLGLVVSCQAKAAEFASKEFSRLVEALPGLTVVVEHLGGVGAEPAADYALHEKVLGLAHYPNVYMKVPGFGELLPRPMPFRGLTFSGTPRALTLAYEAFGPKRLMWGSNFPPSAALEGYANTLRFPLERSGLCSDEDKAWVFGLTARAVWTLG